MAYLNDTYSNISNRFNDWLQEIGGGNVSDVALDTLNRAQAWLLGYMHWDGIIKRETLTVSSGSATLPTDLIAILEIYTDSDSDGKPDAYYYNEAGTNDGYYITNSFTKAAGQSKTINFYDSNISNSPTVVYLGDLTDFTGSGTEYSYFPGELLLRTAQMLRIEETGLVGAEMTVIINSQQRLLRDYVEMEQNQNAEPRMRVNDMLGNEVILTGTDLRTGQHHSINHGRESDPSYLRF